MYYLRAKKWSFHFRGSFEKEKENYMGTSGVWLTGVYRKTVTA